MRNTTAYTHISHKIEQLYNRTAGIVLVFSTLIYSPASGSADCWAPAATPNGLNGVAPSSPCRGTREAHVGMS